jgi:hypothetical protein
MKLTGSIDIFKSDAAPDEERPTALIRGVISTESVDLQGETIAQNGLDFSYFLRKGWLNLDHKPGVENVLGYPLSVETRGRETHLEGVLLLDRPKAKEVYDTARSLQKAGGGRRLGFSIEGQVIERDPKNPKRILKARVLNCAITHNPINADTALELLKSLIGYQTPSAPANGESLSALVPQQLNPQIANAAGPSQKNNDFYDSVLADTIRTLYANYPAAPLAEITKAAQQMMEARRLCAETI